MGGTGTYSARSLGTAHTWRGAGGACLLPLRRWAPAPAGLRSGPHQPLLPATAFGLDGGLTGGVPLVIGFRLLDRLLGQTGSVVPAASSSRSLRPGRRACCVLRCSPRASAPGSSTPSTRSCSTGSTQARLDFCLATPCCPSPWQRLWMPRKSRTVWAAPPAGPGPR